MEMGTRKTALSRGAEVVAALPSRYLVQPCLSDSMEFPAGTTRSTRAVREDLASPCLLLLAGDIPTTSVLL